MSVYTNMAYVSLKWHLSNEVFLLLFLLTPHHGGVRPRALHMLSKDKCHMTAAPPAPRLSSMTRSPEVEHDRKTAVNCTCFIQGPEPSLRFHL